MPLSSLTITKHSLYSKGPSCSTALSISTPTTWYLEFIPWKTVLGGGWNAGIKIRCGYLPKVSTYVPRYVVRSHSVVLIDKVSHV